MWGFFLIRSRNKRENQISIFGTMWTNSIRIKIMCSHLSSLLRVWQISLFMINSTMKPTQRQCSLKLSRKFEKSMILSSRWQMKNLFSLSQWKLNNCRKIFLLLKPISLKNQLPIKLNVPRIKNKHKTTKGIDQTH